MGKVQEVSTQSAMGIKVKPKAVIKEHGFWLHELSGKSYWGMQLYLPIEGPSVEITEVEHNSIDTDRLDLLAVKFPNNEKYKQWAAKRQEETKAAAEAKAAEGWACLITSVVCLFIGIGFLIQAKDKKIMSDDMPTFYMLPFIVGIILTFVSVITLLAAGGDQYSKIVNPQYHAAHRLIQDVSNVKQ